MSFMDVTGGGPMSIGYNNMLAQNQVNQFNQSMANSAAQNNAAIAAANSYNPWANSGGGFGQQTADYSALGAAYGRQVGQAAAPGTYSPGNAGGLSSFSGMPLGAGGSKGFAPPDSGDYQTHDAWAQAYDAYMGGTWSPFSDQPQPSLPSGGSAATDYYGSQLTNPNSNAFQGGGWQPTPQVPTPQPRPPTADLNPGAAIPSGWGGYGGIGSDARYGGGSSKTGFAPPDSGNYQTHDAWAQAYDAYMGGTWSPFSDQPQPGGGGAWDTTDIYGRPNLPPAGQSWAQTLSDQGASNAGGGAWSRVDQFGRPYQPPAQQAQSPAYPMAGGGALPDYNGDMWGGRDAIAQSMLWQQQNPIIQGGGLNQMFGFGGKADPSAGYFTTGVEGAGIGGWGASYYDPGTHSAAGG